MPRAIVTEFTFEVPEDFEEQSIAMWGDAPDQRVSRFAIVCTRRPLEGASLESLVDRELSAVSPKLSATVLEKARVRVKGLAALDVRLRTKPAGATAFIYQRTVTVDWLGTAVMFTASSAMKERATCDAHLDRMLESTRWRAR